MTQNKRLRNLIYNLKDKASVVAATLSPKRHASSVRVSVLRATTHTLSHPPSESRIVAVLSIGHGSHLLPRACINALMDRLHRTRSATVALKCLFTLHNIIARGPFTLRDLLSCYPSYGSHNFLNLSTFRDDSDLQALQLSSWVRWYGAVLEQSLLVSRVLGYYLSSSSAAKKGSAQTQEIKHFGVSNSDLLYKIEGLVGFVERISEIPEECLHLQRNELVYEMVRLVAEDYRSIQYEILLRVQELGNRVDDQNLEVGEMAELVGYLTRLEESRQRLVLLFVNRKRNDGFWDLINKTKNKTVTKKEEIQGKWMVTVRTSRRNDSSEWTRFTNPFLDGEAGQLIPVQPGWVGVNRFHLSVPTVGY